MADRLRSRVAALWAQPSARALAIEIAPVVVFLALIWIKLALFSLPPWHHMRLAWGGWFRPAEISQAMLGSLATLLLLFSPTLFLSTTARFCALWTLDLLITLVVLADFVHFRFFGDVISIAATGAVEQLSLVADSVRELLLATDALFFLDLTIALALLPWYKRMQRESPGVPRWNLGMVSARMLVAGSVLLLIMPVRIVVLDPDETFRLTYLRFFGVRKIGLLNYHAYEAGRHFFRDAVTGDPVGPEERERALSFISAWRPVATAPSDLFGVAEGRNIIFVMMESVQAFPLGLEIEGKKVTPNLDALGRRSLFFENFYGQTWEGMTSDGEFTSLQSLHPLPAGSVATTYPFHRYRGIPRILQERGYATISAHAYYGDLWNMRQMHPRLGFQTSRFRESYQITEEFGPGLSDREFFRQTVPELRRLPQPFMAYLMTLSTHHPFELPEKYKELKLGDLEGTLLGNYVHTVHYLDSALGDLFEQLQKSGLWDNSVLVIYGDHKAQLGSPTDLEKLLRRYRGFPARSAGFDPRYWREENRIPLLIHLPNDTAVGIYGVSGGHLDIAPTVLNLVGIKNHTMVTLGRDLTRKEDGLVVMRTGGFVLADTVCVLPSVGVESRQCRTVTTDAALDAGRFEDRFRQARQRLEISDLILHGDLISAEQARSADRADPARSGS